MQRRLANMFPYMEYVVRVGWLPDGNRSVLSISVITTFGFYFTDLLCWNYMPLHHRKREIIVCPSMIFYRSAADAAD